MAVTQVTGQQTKDGTIATADLANDAVTYAKLQNASATQRILARKTAAAGDYEECTLSEVLDFLAGVAQGDIVYRSSSGWVRLPAGTDGNVLETAGAAANPSWVDKAANQGEMRSAGSTRKYSTPGNQHYHPSAAKGWCRFNGTGTPAILESYNVSGLTDNGTGLWNIQWSEDLQNNNYVVLVNSKIVVGTLVTICGVDSTDEQAATDVGIAVYSWNGVALPLYDSSNISVLAFGL